MTSINIYKKAHGSLLSTPGDGVLFYTADYSPRANAVGGIFIDNPPTLDPDRASLIWRYYPDTDRYLLVHVQGSHAVFPTQGRNYPFRAAYEVTRADLNTLAATPAETAPAAPASPRQARLPLTDLFAAMPRIVDFAATAQRVETAAAVTRTQHPLTPEARCLATHILAAAQQGQRLAVAIDVEGHDLKGNAIFADPRLATLLAAIEALPLAVARYASFAFNVDARHAALTDDLLLTLFPATATTQAPKGIDATGLATGTNAIVLPWDVVTTTPAATADTRIARIVYRSIPGKSKALLTTDDFLRNVAQRLRDVQRIDTESPFHLPQEDLDVWFALGHTFDEIKIASWADASILYDDLSPERRTEFITRFKTEAIGWKVKGIEENLFKAFNFGPAVWDNYRQKAFLDFFRQGSHRFLFRGPDGKTYIENHLNAELLEDRLKADCQTFSEIVNLFRSLPYVAMPLWTEAFEHCNLQLELVDQLPDITDLPEDKQHFLTELHAQQLSARLPHSWKAFLRLRDEAEEDAFKRQQLTLISAAGYKALIETGIDKRKTVSGKPVPADKERRHRYDELAKIGEVYLRKKYIQIPTTLAEHATEAILPAILDYSRHLLLDLIPQTTHNTHNTDTDTNQATKTQKTHNTPELYENFCRLIDKVSRYPDLWTIFRRQFTFWDDNDIDSLAQFAQQLTASITAAEQHMTQQRLAAAQQRARKKAIKAAQAADQAAAKRGEPITKGHTNPDTLYITPTLAEQSAVSKNKHRTVILNIAARLHDTQDPNHKNMATQLEKKALTERQRTYRKILGTKPEKPLTHWIRAGIICLICLLAGYTIGRVTAHIASKAHTTTTTNNTTTTDTTTPHTTNTTTPDTPQK